MFVDIQKQKKSIDKRLKRANKKEMKYLKEYPRVHNKDKNMVWDWEMSFYDEY